MPDAQHIFFPWPTPPRAADTGADGGLLEPPADPSAALLQAVDDLYRAAESDAHWPAAVGRTARALSACAAGLVWGGEDGRWHATAWYARREGVVDVPSVNGGVCDEVSPLLVRLRAVPPGRVVTAGERTGTAARALAIRVAAQGGAVAALVALRAPERAGFSDGERQVAESLAPHLCRALAMAARGRRVSAVEHVREGLLEAPARGALLVDAAGRVLEMIGVAARLCEARDGLALEDGRIVATVASCTPALRCAIRDVTCGQGAATLRVPALRVPRDGFREPLELRVVPLPATLAGAPLPLGAPVPVAAVIVSDVAHRPPADAAVLACLYGFTPAEASLAETLAAGRTLEQAARATGLTRETMRSRLKGLFRKTGTRRQAELVGRLLCGVALVDSPLPYRPAATGGA